MDDISVIQWVAGGAITLICGGMAHLHIRIVEIEKQVLELVKEVREDNSRAIKDLWEARDRDSVLREKDRTETTNFRHYVLTSLATKDDSAALETRIAGAVRMIVNDQMRRGRENKEF